MSRMLGLGYLALVVLIAGFGTLGLELGAVAVRALRRRRLWDKLRE
jgi:hypothetical protein